MSIHAEFLTRRHGDTEKTKKLEPQMNTDEQRSCNEFILICVHLYSSVVNFLLFSVPPCLRVKSTRPSREGCR
jgi:hypothetical protein